MRIRILLAALLLSYCMQAQDLKAGIYYLAPEGPQRIEKQTGWGGSWGVGMGNVTVKAPIDYAFSGAHAKVTTTTTPEFLFVYEKDASIAVVMGDVFRCKDTNDPTLGEVVHMLIHKNKRKIDNFLYEQFILDSMRIEAIDPYQYHVKLAYPLDPGEYGFMFRLPSIYGQSPLDYQFLWGFSVEE